MEARRDEVFLLLKRWKDGNVAVLAVFNKGETQFRITGGITELSEDWVQVGITGTDDLMLAFVRLPLFEVVNFEYVEGRDADKDFRPLIESAVSSVAALHFAPDCSCLLLEMAKPPGFDAC
jgi:hypothetical protein